MAMTWREIRAHLAALHAEARAAGATQQAIADRGGIAGQNTVSRVLSNDKLGPSVEIFVRAIEGLGKSVSEFFLELEGQAGASRDLSIGERLQRLERTMEALSRSVSTLLPAPGVTPGNQETRPSYDDSAFSSDVVDHAHIAARLERQQIAAIMQAARDSLLFTLARRDDRVAQVGERDGTVPTHCAAGRDEPRRRRAARPAESTATPTQTKGEGTR
jgi:transcriptional regulator with XRE-family HTH domain